MVYYISNKSKVCMIIFRARGPSFTAESNEAKAVHEYNDRYSVTICAKNV